MEDDNKCNKKNSLNRTREFSINVNVLHIINNKINSLCDSLKLPVYLNELYLIHDELQEVPLPVMNLPNLKILDISFNKIQYFNDTPKFCHNIERLNISNNKLLGPPYWIWAESPRNLNTIDLSYNEHITNNFLEELLQYTTLVTDVKMNNCHLTSINNYAILNTLSNVQYLQLGTNNMNLYPTTNKFEEIPFTGLEKCSDIEKIDLTNTSIYNINKNITIFKNLQEINLSLNNLNGIPIEFCSLANLKVCILSMNYILYLPDEFAQLTKLNTLSLDSNELCMFPEIISDLPQLKRLDLYDNKLYEIPNNINSIAEIDVAQNYFEEPEEEDYVAKRSVLRKNVTERKCGSKKEIEKPESVEIEDFSCDFNDEMSSSISENNENEHRSLSSPENWDSDEYWIPDYLPHTVTPNTQWVNFVKTKIAEGHFCPIDAHKVCIADKILLEKLNNSQVQYESDGQFDDFSEDDS